MGDGRHGAGGTGEKGWVGRGRRVKGSYGGDVGSRGWVGRKSQHYATLGSR